MHDQNTQRANHAAITRNRFPRAYATGHACENMQDRSVAKVTKPKSIPLIWVNKIINKILRRRSAKIKYNSIVNNYTELIFKHFWGNF